MLRQIVKLWSAALLVVVAIVLEAGAVELHRFEVVNQYPHDPDAFTQGLLFYQGQLFESTGLNGRSSLRRVALESGEVLAQRSLEQQYFGEGLARVGNRLIQLTWKRGRAFVYDLESFELVNTFRYLGQGWGLTYDGEQLIMSDGSNKLYFRNPETFAVTRTVNVTDALGRPLARLNELEYINGEVWANVFQTFWIVRIDPANGRLLGLIDMRGILRDEDRYGGEDVLNGIAYDPATERLFVTGKLYQHLYEIKLVPLHP